MPIRAFQVKRVNAGAVPQRNLVRATPDTFACCVHMVRAESTAPRMPRRNTRRLFSYRLPSLPKGRICIRQQLFQPVRDLPVPLPDLYSHCLKNCASPVRINVRRVRSIRQQHIIHIAGKIGRLAKQIITKQKLYIRIRYPSLVRLLYRSHNLRVYTGEHFLKHVLCRPRNGPSSQNIVSQLFRNASHLVQQHVVRNIKFSTNVVQKTLPSPLRLISPQCMNSRTPVIGAPKQIANNHIIRLTGTSKRVQHLLLVINKISFERLTNLRSSDLLEPDTGRTHNSCRNPANDREHSERQRVHWNIRCPCNHLTNICRQTAIQRFAAHRLANQFFQRNIVRQFLPDSGSDHFRDLTSATASHPTASTTQPSQNGASSRYPKPQPGFDTKVFDKLLPYFSVLHQRVACRRHRTVLACGGDSIV